MLNGEFLAYVEKCFSVDDLMVSFAKKIIVGVVAVLTAISRVTHGHIDMITSRSASKDNVLLSLILNRIVNKVDMVTKEFSG